MFRCSGCGLIFADPNDYLAEDEYDAVDDLEQLTEEQRAEFSRVFSEGIDTSDADGNMYSDYGMAQDAMANGLFEHVRVAVSRFSNIQSSDQVKILDVGCATGFLLNEAKKAFPNASVRGVEPSPVSCQKDASSMGSKSIKGL